MADVNEEKGRGLKGRETYPKSKNSYWVVKKSRGRQEGRLWSGSRILEHKIEICNLRQ